MTNKLHDRKIHTAFARMLCCILAQASQSRSRLTCTGAATQTGTHPRITTERNINRFRQQLKMLGFSYDWDREVATTDPDYYK